MKHRRIQFISAITLSVLSISICHAQVRDGFDGFADTVDAAKEAIEPKPRAPTATDRPKVDKKTAPRTRNIPIPEFREVTEMIPVEVQRVVDGKTVIEKRMEARTRRMPVVTQEGRRNELDLYDSEEDLTRVDRSSPSQIRGNDSLDARNAPHTNEQPWDPNPRNTYRSIPMPSTRDYEDADGWRHATRQTPSKTRKAINQLAQAKSDADKKKGEAELRKALDGEYEAFLKQHEARLANVEKQLETLKEELQRRRSAKKELLELKMKTIVNNINGLGWPGDHAQGFNGFNPPNFGTYQQQPAATLPQDRRPLNPRPSGNYHAPVYPGNSRMNVPVDGPGPGVTRPMASPRETPSESNVPRGNPATSFSREFEQFNNDHGSDSLRPGPNSKSRDAAGESLPRTNSRKRANPVDSEFGEVSKDNEMRLRRLEGAKEGKATERIEPDVE